MVKQSEVNEGIVASSVRLIDETGLNKGVCSTREALDYARSVSLDLVVIADQPVPVCKVMDFKRHQFEEKKKRKASHRKQQTTRIELKELKFRPEIEEADYQVKLKKMLGFLAEGHKVKVTLRFRGREMSHQEVGMALLTRLEADVAELAVIEQRPKLEGRQVIMVLSAKKKK